MPRRRRPHRALPLPGQCAPPSAAPSRVTCSGCGAVLSAPRGQGRFACPLCDSELAASQSAAISVVAPPAAVPVTPRSPARPSEQAGEIPNDMVHADKVQVDFASETGNGKKSANGGRGKQKGKSKILSNSSNELPRLRHSKRLVNGSHDIVDIEPIEKIDPSPSQDLSEDQEVERNLADSNPSSPARHRFLDGGFNEWDGVDATNPPALNHGTPQADQFPQTQMYSPETRWTLPVANSNSWHDCEVPQENSCGVSQLDRGCAEVRSNPAEMQNQEMLCDHWAKDEVMILSYQQRKNRYSGNHTCDAAGSRKDLANGGKLATDIDSPTKIWRESVDHRARQTEDTRDQHKRKGNVKVTTKRKKLPLGHPDDWDTALAAANAAEQVERGGRASGFQIVDRTGSPDTLDAPTAPVKLIPQPVLRRSTRTHPQIGAAMPQPTPASSTHGGRKHARGESAQRQQPRQRQRQTQQQQRQSSEQESSEFESEGQPEHEQQPEPEPLPTLGQLVRAKGRVIQRYRCTEDVTEWFPPERQIRGPFWTKLQRVFHRAFHYVRALPYDHRQISLEPLAQIARVPITQFTEYFTYLPGLHTLVAMPGHHVFDWMQIFYATVWIDPRREHMMYMFEGEQHTLYRDQIAAALRVELRGDRLHELCHPDIGPPRQRHGAYGIVPPSYELVRVCFKEPFGPASPRHPSDLTPIASVILEVLRRTILPRSGYREAITALQQWTLAYILEKKDFDIVDFLLCEIEDAIADGLRSNRRLPYAHYLGYLFCRFGSEMGPLYDKLHSSRDIFPLYRAAKGNDRRRGHRATTAAHETWTHEQRQQVEAEDTELCASEVQAGLEGFLDADLTSDSSDENFVPIPSVRMAHDQGARGSGSQFDTPTQQTPHPAPATPVTLSAALAHDQEAGGSGSQFDTPTQQTPHPAPAAPVTLSAAQPSLSADIAALTTSVRELTRAIITQQQENTRRQRQQDEFTAIRAIQQQQQRTLDILHQQQQHNAYQFDYIYRQIGLAPPTPFPPLSAPLAQAAPGASLPPSSQQHVFTGLPPFSHIRSLLLPESSQPVGTTCVLSSSTVTSPLPDILTKFSTPSSVMLEQFIQSASHATVPASESTVPATSSIVVRSLNELYPSVSSQQTSGTQTSSPTTASVVTESTIVTAEAAGSIDAPEDTPTPPVDPTN